MDSILLYGKTDTGKTTLLAETARELVAQGMKGRLVSADSGWGPFGDLTLPGQGVEAFDLTAFCTPSILNDGKPEGPFSTLNAISDGAWFMEKNGKFVLTKAPPVDFYIFEGLKSFADVCMQDHVRNGRPIAEDMVGKFTVTAQVDEKPVPYASGQPGRAHYNHVQRYILTDWWPRTKGLRTKLIFVTSHEAEGEDDISAGKSVLGPALIGRASIGSITQIFQDSLHMVKITKLVGTNLQAERRAYYTSHPQMISETTPSQTQFWPAKISLTVPQTMEFKKRFPGGYFIVGEHEQGFSWLNPLLSLRGYLPDSGITGEVVPAVKPPVKPTPVTTVPPAVTSSAQIKKG